MKTSAEREIAVVITLQGTAAKISPSGWVGVINRISSAGPCFTDGGPVSGVLVTP